jgi:hypothetical protein
MKALARAIAPDRVRNAETEDSTRDTKSLPGGSTVYTENPDPTFPSNGNKTPKASLTLQELKNRLRTGVEGNSRPLACLVEKEQQLHAQSAIIAEFSDFDAWRSDRILRNLIANQVANTIGPPSPNSHQQAERRRGAINLYLALESMDPVESILDGNIVGLNNAAMKCFAEAANTSNLAVRDTNLRLGIKGTAVLGQLLDLRDRLGRRRDIDTVSEVKGEPGRRAIIELRGPNDQSAGPKPSRKRS